MESRPLIELPDTAAVPVLRTDFSNDAEWDRLKAELMAPADDGSDYEPALEFVERRDLSGLDASALENETPRGYPTSYEFPFLIVVDDVAVNTPDHPVLLIDLSEEETTPSFRALPREIAAIEANLSLANMDFFEFRDSADETGVFRGFA
jgi:Domain of unknown function (DUF6924)